MALGFRSRSCCTESMETSGGEPTFIQSLPASLTPPKAHGAHARGPTFRDGQTANSTDADSGRSRRATWAYQGNSEMIRTLTPARTPATEAGHAPGDGLPLRLYNQVTVPEASVPEIRVEPDHYDDVTKDVVLVAEPDYTFALCLYVAVLESGA